jgi:alkylated DNA nucleotide flippase Atl1
MAKGSWKLAKGRTWRGKLEEAHPNHGKIVPMPSRYRKSLGAGTMVIPRPLSVDALMRRPKKGQVITVSQIREALAREFGATAACPMTTGMFMRIAAEAADEVRRAGKSRITPYWRTIMDDGRLMETFPGGAKAQAAKLREEGVPVNPARGKKPAHVLIEEAKLVRL